MDQIVLKIRKIRKEKKLTQSDVAEKLGLTIRAYSKIESGETQLTIDRLRKLVEIFDVPFNSIFQEDCSNSKTNQHNSNIEDITLINHYEETINILKKHIKILNTIIDKKINKNNI